MKSKVSKFFEVKVQYQKMQDDGKEKKVSEQYVVEAFSFTEAESRIIEEMTPILVVSSALFPKRLLLTMKSSSVTIVQTINGL